MKYLSSVLCLILIVVSGIYFFVLAQEDPNKPSISDTHTDWQGGRLFTGRVEAEDQPLKFKLQWVKDKKVIDISSAWQEMPTFKKLSDGKIVMIVGEAGDYNVQVWSGPRGPMVAMNFTTKEAAQKKMAEIHLGSQPKSEQ